MIYYLTKESRWKVRIYAGEKATFRQGLRILNSRCSYLLNLLNGLYFKNFLEFQVASFPFFESFQPPIPYKKVFLKKYGYVR